MYANNKTVGIIGISHTYSSIVKALELYNYKIVVCDIDNEKLSKEKYPKYNDYKDLLGNIDIAFISTPPKFHYEIAKFFLEKGVKVICEKPLVTTMNQLENLSLYDDLYNILHFSYGEEIEWFIKNFPTKELPKKIICNINDPYIKDRHIMESKLSLNGSYLDETINPLSAIKRIYRERLEFISNTKNYYKDDEYDYSSSSVFKMNNTLIYINTNWNDYGNKEKYIDLYFKDKIIRLDSVNVKVIDITNSKELFTGTEIRMDAHYKNGLKDIKSNKNVFIELNKVILEGEINAENNIY